MRGGVQLQCQPSFLPWLHRGQGPLHTPRRKIVPLTSRRGETYGTQGGQGPEPAKIFLMLTHFGQNSTLAVFGFPFFFVFVSAVLALEHSFRSSKNHSWAEFLQVLDWLNLFLNLPTSLSLFVATAALVSCCRAYICQGLLCIAPCWSQSAAVPVDAKPRSLRRHVGVQKLSMPSDSVPIVSVAANCLGCSHVSRRWDAALRGLYGALWSTRVCFHVVMAMEWR